MKLHAALILLAMAGCATVSSRTSDAEPLAGSGGPGGDVRGSSEPVRMETPAGTFLVHPNNAEDFAKLLAGEPTDKQYMSVSDVP
ncbi:hypothetical protein F0U60_39335 [Archangium minus]|uniref:Lipoprotein n=1 Tax=Archangium minus TaxID=83450 RepID=A0ABY9X264_9BACT|nr:hypothetical protein F0U61_38965 [Archangium violaceum]WNG49504.1 hypothetical protein F0U60_39335 [Archangium minus]